jgi:integrase
MKSQQLIKLTRMACIKKKQGSPYWWIKYRDDRAKLCEESTGYRHDLAADTRKAKALKAQKTADELKQQPARQDSPARWDRWVPDYMNIRYAGRERTLDSCRTRWGALSIFLAIHLIVQPRFLTREQVFGYMKWRQKGDKPHHVRPGHHNTARMELKFLSLLMNEAMLRGYVQSNPLVRLGIQKIASAEKPEMTDAEIQLAREGLKQEPKWMGIIFEIALYTGCRLSETNVILDDVDLLKKLVTFRDPKGGQGGNKDYSIPLRLELVPLFARLKHERQGRGQRAYDALPPEGASEWWTPARAFHRFFKKTVGIEHLTFHCLRVSFITRCARAGISMPKMMKLVNHATELIHKIYQRLNVEDLKTDSERIPEQAVSFSRARQRLQVVRVPAWPFTALDCQAAGPSAELWG